MDYPKAGWNPKSSTELFLGLLPYLLVFVVVPLCLLLVCWCSRYLVRLCSRKLSSTGSTGCWARMCPGRQNGVPTPTCRPANGFCATGRGPNDSPHPETLFTNYTNYNPILEGELDLFPISYTAQSGESLPSHNSTEPQRTVDHCASSLYVELSLLPLASEFGLRESRVHDPPPTYPDDPPPSYESLFTRRDSLDDKSTAATECCEKDTSSLRGVVVN